MKILPRFMFLLPEAILLIVSIIFAMILIGVGHAQNSTPTRLLLKQAVKSIAPDNPTYSFYLSSGCKGVVTELCGNAQTYFKNSQKLASYQSQALASGWKEVSLDELGGFKNTRQYQKSTNGIDLCALLGIVDDSSLGEQNGQVILSIELNICHPSVEDNVRHTVVIWDMLEPISIPKRFRLNAGTIYASTPRLQLYYDSADGTKAYFSIAEYDLNYATDPSFIIYSNDFLSHCVGAQSTAKPQCSPYLTTQGGIPVYSVSDNGAQFYETAINKTHIWIVDSLDLSTRLTKVELEQIVGSMTHTSNSQLLDKYSNKITPQNN